MIEMQIRRPCPDCDGTGASQTCTPCSGTGKRRYWVPAVVATNVLGHATNEEDAEMFMDSLISGMLTPERFHEFNRTKPGRHGSAPLPAPTPAPLPALSTEHVQVAVHTWPLQTQLDAFALLQKMHTPLRVLEYQDATEEYPAFLMNELQREKLETLTLQQLCQTGVTRLTQIHHLSEPSLRQLHHLAGSVFLSFNA